MTSIFYQIIYKKLPTPLDNIIKSRLNEIEVVINKQGRPSYLALDLAGILLKLRADGGIDGERFRMRGDRLDALQSALEILEKGGRLLREGDRLTFTSVRETIRLSDAREGNECAVGGAAHSDSGDEIVLRSEDIAGMMRLFAGLNLGKLNIYRRHNYICFTAQICKKCWIRFDVKYDCEEKLLRNMAIPGETFKILGMIYALYPSDLAIRQDVERGSASFHLGDVEATTRYLDGVLPLAEVISWEKGRLLFRTADDLRSLAKIRMNALLRKSGGRVMMFLRGRGFEIQSVIQAGVEDENSAEFVLHQSVMEVIAKTAGYEGVDIYMNSTGDALIICLSGIQIKQALDVIHIGDIQYLDFRDYIADVCSILGGEVGI